MFAFIIIIWVHCDEIKKKREKNVWLLSQTAELKGVHMRRVRVLNGGHETLYCHTTFSVDNWIECLSLLSHSHTILCLQINHQKVNCRRQLTVVTKNRLLIYTWLFHVVLSAIFYHEKILCHHQHQCLLTGNFF